MTFRSALYKSAKLLGDLHAVEHHRVPQRLVRKIIYRHAFRLAGAVCRLVGVSR